MQDAFNVTLECTNGERILDFLLSDKSVCCLQLLLAYVGTLRHEGPEVDHNMVSKLAKDLYKAGEKRLGTDENTFIRIFSGCSWAHLAAVASSYDHTYGKKLEKVLSGLECTFLYQHCLY